MRWLYSAETLADTWFGYGKTDCYLNIR